MSYIDDTPSSVPILLQRANVYNGAGQLLLDIDILIENGKITTVGTTGTRLTPPTGARVIDTAGRYVTPGMHDFMTHTLIRHRSCMYIMWRCDFGRVRVR
jgi:imidazolonepropionase-like amidohydrolase